MCEHSLVPLLPLVINKRFSHCGISGNRCSSDSVVLSVVCIFPWIIEYLFEDNSAWNNFNQPTTNLTDSDSRLFTCRLRACFPMMLPYVLTRHYISGLLLGWSWKSGSTAYTELRIHFPILFIQQQQSWCCAHVPQALAPASPQRRGWFSAHQLQRTCPRGGTSWNTEWRALTAMLWRTTSAPLGTYLFPALLCDHRLVWDVRILLAFRHEILDKVKKIWREWSPLGIVGCVLRVFLRFQTIRGISVNQVWRKLLSCLKLLSDGHNVLCLCQPNNKPSTEMTRCRNCW